MLDSSIADCSSIVTKLEDQILETGMHLETGTDFYFFRDVISTLPQKNQLGPKFDPDNKDFDPRKAFWIIGRDRFGIVVHTQALAITDLHGQTLANFLSGNFTEFFPPTSELIDPTYMPGPGAQRIRGVGGYHGEFWMRGGDNSFRGMGLAAPLVRLALLVAMRTWSPDFIYCFMRTNVVCKGLAARAGFMHTEPDSLVWSQKGDAKINKAWTAWLDSDDMMHLINLTAMDLELPMVERTLNIKLKAVA